MAMTVFVWSRAEIENGAAEGTDAVISVRGHADRGAFDTLDTAMAQAVLGDVDAMLVLRSDDIGVPRLGAATRADRRAGGDGDRFREGDPRPSARRHAGHPV